MKNQVWHIFTPLRGRSPPAQSKGKADTHTDIGKHPCIQTYIHASRHPDIHGKVCHWHPTGLAATCTRGAGNYIATRALGGFCLGLSRSVSVGRQDTRTNTPTMSIMQCPRVTHTSAVSTMRSDPACITGIASMWSKTNPFVLINLQKTLQNTDRAPQARALSSRFLVIATSRDNAPAPSEHADLPCMVVSITCSTGRSLNKSKDDHLPETQRSDRDLQRSGTVRPTFPLRAEALCQLGVGLQHQGTNAHVAEKDDVHLRTSSSSCVRASS